MTEEEERHKHRLLLDLTVEEMGSPGIVVNPDLAARTPCKCYPIDDKKLCFSKGIIGFLSQPQRQAYCPTEVDVTDSGIIERVKLFREAATEAHKKIEALPKGERLEPYLIEMGKELRKRGVEI